MKRTVYALAACAITVGCSSSRPDDPESVGAVGQPLNSTLVPRSNLTRRTFIEFDETKRQANTFAYYNAVGVSPNGSKNAGTISSRLGTLDAFIGFYNFEGRDKSAVYYNRGDLGIGRDMHCVDNSDGQIACYVRNFAAGDDNSEFTFGLSRDIAFANIDAGRAFATVAMVFRASAPEPNKMFFVVYDKEGDLSPFAALDRVGINFAGEFSHNPRPDSTIFGTPGVHFNNHIPSNCESCHGVSSHAGGDSGSWFLPFDLDQFEYENVPGRTRGELELPFAELNRMVRKAAAANLGMFGQGQAIKNQLDDWYHNTNHAAKLAPPFDETVVPDAWKKSPAASSVYKAVIRPFCQTCHLVTRGVQFRTEDDFLAPGIPTEVVDDICNHQMPHALQTLRLFWQSSAPFALESYFRSKGNTTLANRLHACGPANVATLDPHLIMASAPL